MAFSIKRIESQRLVEREIISSFSPCTEARGIKTENLCFGR